MTKGKSWKTGDYAELSVEITDDLVRQFADWSSDRNPLHVDSDYASATRFHRRVAHGMSFGALFSRLITTVSPCAEATSASRNIPMISSAL